MTIKLRMENFELVNGNTQVKQKGKSLKNSSCKLNLAHFYKIIFVFANFFFNKKAWQSPTSY